MNGNVAALAPKEIVRLAKAIPARVEVNLFHRTEARVRRIVRALTRQGGRDVLGTGADARIPGLDSRRALTHRAGIYGADVVLVPLEDGDRTEALVRMGKTVIAIDLNPLSRTAQMATVPVVDELTRAVLNIEKFVRELRRNPEEAARIVKSYNKAGNLDAIYTFLGRRLRNLVKGRPVRRKRRVDQRG